MKGDTTMNLKCRIKLPEGYGSYMKQHPQEWTSILMGKNDDGSIDALLLALNYGEATIELPGNIKIPVPSECICLKG